MLTSSTSCGWCSKDDEIPSHHFSERNTCLLSSCCCCMEGDDNWLWIEVYIPIDQWFSEANLWCQYHLSWNKLWLWNISTKSIFETSLTTFLLKIKESANITSTAVPVGNILNDKWVEGGIVFFFYMLQQLLMFLVSTMQVNEIHVVSNTHFCQYPFSILWPEFLVVSDIALLC